MQSKYPLLALYLPYTRYTGTRGIFFLKSANILLGVIFIFGPTFFSVGEGGGGSV